ncbi:tail fiber protein [Photorhabdus viridis]|uniref:tail fiber protein n=1 Tax=Photorhabdus viridis TaxID=3163327 RepID=UPI003307985D
MKNKTNPENINIETQGPSISDLKNRFKEGSIPLQTDFANLIDIADIGRRAVGKAPDQTDTPNSALRLDSHGRLVVKAGNGITIDSNGVNIDPNRIFPKGMIVMFSGNSAPDGWTFCDGNNGTPDLRSRFVMCGETISETGKSSNKASGSGDGKNFSKNTTSTVVLVNVTVQNTTLTESQIPEHKHIESMPYYNTQGFAYGHITIGKTDYKLDNSNNGYIWTKSYGTDSSGSDYHPYTSNIGYGEGHNHNATASSPSHTHSVDVVPPYYILAFIMKL